MATWEGRAHGDINGVNRLLVGAVWDHGGPRDILLTASPFNLGIRALSDYYDVVMPT